MSDIVIIIFLMRSIVFNNKNRVLLFFFIYIEQRDKPQDTTDDPLGEMEMANVIARKQQRKTSSTAYSSNEVNIH